MTTFEEIALLLERMDPAPVADQFRIEWLAANAVGVGRDRNGGYCVLFASRDVAAKLPSVQHALRTGEWRTGADVVLEGTILVLPSGEQFRTAAAAVVAEFLRRGAGHRPIAEVFPEVEDFIALVLRRVLLPPEYVVGLVGELVVLTELLAAFASIEKHREDPTVWWRGWLQQGRDFVLGTTSVEVKTTVLQVSRHQVHGLHQVEARALDGGATERLFLCSMGLRAASAGYSVATLTERIIEQLATPDASGGDMNDAQQRFLDRLKQYGPVDSTGYSHDQMRALEPYTQAYVTTFPPRVYDMSDTNVRIVRSSDLAERFPFVMPLGVSYCIELPPKIPGSIDNPRPHFREFILALARDIARPPSS